MSVTVHVPGPLLRFTDERRTLMIDGASTVRELLALVPPGVRERVLDERERVRSHVNIFVGDTNIRDLAGLSTGLQPGDDVFVLPAVSGGTFSPGRGALP